LTAGIAVDLLGRYVELVAVIIADGKRIVGRSAAGLE
jgi:hypothetical protein